MTCGRGTRGSEAGTTLVELIVTVAIMGFAMLAILGGIGASIIFADVQRKDASARLVLTTAAEQIVSDAAPYRYQVCASSYPAPAAPAGYTLAVNKVAIWEPTSNRYVPATDVPSCSPAPGSDSGLQLIELKVTAEGGSKADKDEFLQVAKRQVET